MVGVARKIAEQMTPEQHTRTLWERPEMRVLLIALEPGHQLPPHVPRSDLVLGVLDGGGHLLVGGRIHELRAGDLAVVPAGDVRGLRCLEGRLVALAVVSPPPGPDDHRALGDGSAWPELETAPDPADLIRAEHGHLLDGIAELARLAQEAALMDPAELAAGVRSVVSFMQEDLLPHASTEERLVYPAVDLLLRAHGGGTVTMSLDHRRIEELATGLQSVSTSHSDQLDRAAAQRTLAALSAVLSLHFDKEEEDYLPRLRQLTAPERTRLIRALRGAPEPEPEIEGLQVGVRHGVGDTDGRA